MDLVLPAADDWHIHLRNDDRTPDAIRAVRAGGTARVMAMPNTDPPLTNGAEASAYAAQLTEQGADFTIHTTIKLTPQTTEADLRDAAQHKVLAVKQYPLGVTTNSDDGVADVGALYPLYEVMQDLDLVLSLHGEVPGVFVMDAEKAFLDTLLDIHAKFPQLRIVLEHITTRAAAELVAELPEQVAATITDHHLAITLDDVVGSRIRPHHFCMPVAKRPDDRTALLEAIRSGDPSFFSGTDSAPHKVADKESACGCAGIFNAPTHMQFLASLFLEHGILPNLRDFTSSFGADFYRLPRQKEQIVLRKKPYRVPARYGAIVPFMAEQDLAFSLDS